MTPALSALLFILFLLGLVALNIPIGVALIVVSFFGISTVLGFDVAATFIANIPREVLASWELSAIPMFLLMGSVALYGGLTDSLFRAARLWLGWLPGGLAIATNFSAAGLGAATGSSMATAVAMGRISVPEMRRSNYDVGLAAAACASAGTLAALIPPSIPLIVYGMLAEQSLVKLFAAGVVPGIITALIYAAMILLRAIITPSIAPRSYEPASWRTRFLVLLEVWPLPLLVVLVFGGLYGGFVGPTEAGAFGAALAIIIAFFKGGLSFKTLRTCLQEACRTTAIILFVAIGAVMFARYVALIGLPDLITDYLTGGAISHLTLILVTVAVYLVLG
ncbi:MAG TPA: TRAP transporter large permease subunit, partial [Burkholderiaceae bacterium]|nr:TRAP transporter large permease subunit [Burkholderiaceae bacterium]